MLKPLLSLRRTFLLLAVFFALRLAAQSMPAQDDQLRRVQLILTRTPEQEKALDALLARQQDPASPDYHRWLTPQEFGVRFGPSGETLAAITHWLDARGFTSVRVNRGRTLVEFSGARSAVRATFAEGAGSALPVGIATAVGGLAGAPRAAVAPTSRALLAETGARPLYTLPSNNTTYYGITPYDFATIYNVLPLWSRASPIDGTGQTIAIVGDTDINPADFVAFRRLFGLPLGNTTVITGTEYLNIIYNGPKPAVSADEARADGDTQWAAGVARGAVIDYVASQATEASSGADLSAAYIVDNNLAPILVDSFTRCEAALGTTGNAFYNALWQQAAAQGITVVTPAGNSGEAGCDAARVAPAAQGRAVSGLASTPYAVAVGGTEFLTPNGPAQYFRTGNDAHFASAVSYIPETVWNDTCTNPTILATAPYAGLSAEQACNGSAATAAGYTVTAGSGGGASSVYAKPAWQVAPGVPADGHRDLPDVALFASQGRTNSFYVVCQQSRNADGKACNLDFPYSDFAAYGGTSLATSAFAGMLALVAQQTGGRLGNAAPTLYTLGQRQYGAGGTAVFHDITTGTNAMPCTTGTTDCVTATAGDTYGILAGGAAGTGYDTASGLGSVDATALAGAWSAGAPSAASVAVLSASPSSVLHGSAVTATVTVTGTGTPTGTVSVAAQAANGAVGYGTLTGGSYTQAFRNFPGGTYGVRAHYAGDTVNAPADSNFVSLTVLPEPSITTLRPLSYDPATGVATQLTSAPYGRIFYIRADVAGVSGQGTATGNVALTDNGSLLGSGVSRLNSSGYTEAQNNAFAPGTHTFAATYAGDSSFNASAAQPVTLTIARAPTTASVQLSPTAITVAGIVTLSATIATQSYGYAAPTGTVTFAAGGTTLGTAVLKQGSDATTYYRNATAVLTLSGGAFSPGTSSVTVAYPGDTNYLASSSPGSVLTVSSSSLARTTTALSVAPTTVAPGGAITFSAVVTPSSPVPTGTVQFAVDGQNTGAAQLLSSTGAASLATTVTGLAAGQHTAVAVYSGDTANYRSSTSIATPFVIAAGGIVSVPNITVTPTTAVQGTFIAVGVRVTTQAGSSTPVATGNVQLVLDGSPYGAVFALTAGAATLPFNTPTVQVGTHILTVYYAGDGTFAPSYANPVTITLTAPGVTASTVILTGVGPAVDLGSSPQFTATIRPATPTPTGIVQIIVDNGNPGTPILVSGASNSLTLPSGLALGNHTVAVFYSGDQTYNFSTSATYPFTVVTPVYKGTFTLTPSNTALTVARIAGTANIPYTVTPAGGFVYPVTFGCSNLPSSVACSFAPTTVTTAGVSSVSTVLTLKINGALHGSVAPAPLERVPAIVYAALFMTGLLGAWRRRRPALLALVLLAVALGGAGCGSGYNSAATAPGNYTIVVNATGGSTTQTAAIQLTVN